MEPVVQTALLYDFRVGENPGLILADCYERCGLRCSPAVHEARR